MNASDRSKWIITDDGIYQVDEFRRFTARPVSDDQNIVQSTGAWGVYGEWDETNGQTLVIKDRLLRSYKTEALAKAAVKKLARGIAGPKVNIEI